MSLLRLLLAVLLLALGVISPLRAADEAPGTRPKKENSLIDEPEIALRKFTLAPGLKADFFAAEPDVHNPVAFSIDDRGRVFVVESDRRRSSVFDIRGHKDWLDADFSFRTVRERAEFLKQQVSPTNPAVIKRLTGGGRGSFEDFNRDGVIDWRDLEVQSERIRLLEDTNGDGRADRVSVFADGFTNILAGVAAGVLARRDEVYFACIPDLWKVSNAEGQARGGTRANLLSGFGVHIAFGGHDMHGLIMGPDGKLYWSIADRGTDTNLFSKIKQPIPGLTPELLADSGCIFRANPDGTELEVIAWGLRNPQELAFDEFGNLFTADNNGDGGDKARWHYVVEGADFGWRIGWQWLEARAYQPKMGSWNGERLWHLAASNTAAYLLPPLAHIGHGPAGLAYNPGTGLPPQFDRHFLLCDFPGHVLMWTNIPDGASFKVGPVKNFFGDLGPTDVAFHPDGGVLVSDWFKSFDKSDKGRLYRIHDPATDTSPLVKETRGLLADGLGKRSPRELIQLLNHQDMRVRLEAQYALAKAGNFSLLSRTAFARTSRSSRLHAIAALSQIVQTNSRSELIKEMESLIPLLEDEDPEVRAQTARLMGAGRLLAAQTQLDKLFMDSSERVRFHAMMAYRDLFTGFLGGGHRHRLGLLDSLKQRANQLLGLNISVLGPSLSWPTAQLGKVLSKEPQVEPYVHHAAIMLLTEIGKVSNTAFTPNMTSFANSSTTARRALLLAYRRLSDPAVASFLSDPDSRLVLEAARAVNDVPIPAAFPQLAALIAPDGASPLSLAPGFSPVSGRTNAKAISTGSVRETKAAKAADSLATSSATELKPDANELELRFFTLRRALNANFRLGDPSNAKALASYAARSDASEPLRIEALELLADWPRPPGRDHFTGLWRPLPPREAAPAADALRPFLASLLHDTPKDIRLAAMCTATALGVKEADLFALVANETQPPAVRVQALKFLAEQKDSRLADAVKLALADKSEALRIEAGRWQRAAGESVEQWAKILASGSIAEKQGVLATLALASPTDADTVLRGRLDAVMARQLDALLSDKLPKELQLDVLDTATKLKSWNLAGKLAQYESRLSTNDALATWRPTLHGGNAAAGRTLFIENQQFACFRCHKIHGEGGDVGPDLTGLGEKKGREYLLQSIVQPNKEITAGFESVLVEMKEGASYAGLVKSETDAELVLNSPEDGVMTLKKTDIKLRQRGLSAMPEDLVTFMSRRELRDLIEFLATAK